MIIQIPRHNRRVRTDVYDLDDPSFEISEEWIGKPVMRGGRVIGTVTGVVHDEIMLKIDEDEVESLKAALVHPTPSVGAITHD